MFARSPCSLSSFLIVFIWFDGGSTAEGLRPVVVRAGQVRQRDCGRSRFVGGLAAGRGPALLLERHGAAQIRTVIRIADLCSGSELKGAHEKQTFICTCIWGKFTPYRHSSVSCSVRASLVCVNIPARRDRKINCTAGRLDDISRNHGTMRLYQVHSQGREARTARSDLGFIRKVFTRLHIYVESETNIPNGVARRTLLRSLLL